MTGKIILSRLSQAFCTQASLPFFGTLAPASQRTSMKVARSCISTFSLAQGSPHPILSSPLASKPLLPFSLFRRCVASWAATPYSSSPQLHVPVTTNTHFSTQPLEVSPVPNKRPIETQSVRDLIEKGTYVDKTGFIQRLLQKGTIHSSLYIPKGFGASLFLSTLKEILLGNKELFKGYQIYDSDYSWKQHPVLHIDFSELSTHSHEQFQESLKGKLQSIALEQGVTLSDSSFGICLQGLIKAMAANNHRLVVLTDNCYSPVTNNLHQPEVAEKNYDSLCLFLNIIKGMCRYIHLTVATGESQFAYLGISSGPDYFQDLTMDARYAGMVGFTEEEIRHSFTPELQAIAEQRSLSEEDLLAEMREWHYGYRFSESDVAVYKPQAVLQFLKEGEIDTSSYRTEATSFLMKTLKAHRDPYGVLYPLTEKKGYLTTLGNVTCLDEMRLTSLMFSSGYLTVTGHIPPPPFSYYHLGFANEAVKQGFLNSVIEDIAELHVPQVTQGREAIQSKLKQHNIADFVSLMNDYFSQMPPSLFKNAHQAFHQLIFFAILHQSQNQGKRRIPIHYQPLEYRVEMPHTNYVLSIGKDTDPTYDKTYSQEGKTVAVVHLQFDPESRQFSEWNGTLFSESGQLLKQL